MKLLCCVRHCRSQTSTTGQPYSHTRVRDKIHANICNCLKSSIWHRQCLWLVLKETIRSQCRAQVHDEIMRGFRIRKRIYHALCRQRDGCCISRHETLFKRPVRGQQARSVRFSRAVRSSSRCCASVFQVLYERIPRAVRRQNASLDALREQCDTIGYVSSG